MRMAYWGGFSQPHDMRNSGEGAYWRSGMTFDSSEAR
jgi:hypothetical protein